MILNEDENNVHPRPIALNGRVFNISPGVPVTIPPGHFEVLQNAKQKVTNPRTGEVREIPTYSYRVV